jgi:hypothetical protein
MTTLLHPLIPETYAALHPAPAASLGFDVSGLVRVHLASGAAAELYIQLDDSLPENLLLVPRSMGVPIEGLTTARLEVVERSYA